MLLADFCLSPSPALGCGQSGAIISASVILMSSSFLSMVSRAQNSLKPLRIIEQPSVEFVSLVGVMSFTMAIWAKCNAVVNAVRNFSPEHVVNV